MKESIDFQFKHEETGEIKTVSLSLEKIQEMLEWDLLDGLTCGCEPIGETNVVECGCDDYFEGFHLLPRHMMKGLTPTPKEIEK